MSSRVCKLNTTLKPLVHLCNNVSAPLMPDKLDYDSDFLGHLGLNELGFWTAIVAGKIAPLHTYIFAFISNSMNFRCKLQLHDSHPHPIRSSLRIDKAKSYPKIVVEVNHDFELSRGGDQVTNILSYLLVLRWSSSTLPHRILANTYFLAYM